jgi:esterase/lipase superfamily enzyme
MRIAVLLVAVLLSAGCSTRPTGVLGLVAEAAPDATRLDMLVATTRAPSENPNIVFTGERGSGVSLSAFTVSIPPEQNRRVGEVQWPQRLPANPEREFATLDVKPLADVNEARFWLNRHLPKSRRVLIFVHGFNNRFEDAVYRFAQIVKDSDANVVPILFTWPSRGSIFAYGYDRESGNYSRTSLENLLQDLARDPAVGEVSILAHSMGNWVTMEALRQMAIRNGSIPPKIANVMLAAPDVDVDVFRSQISDIHGKLPRFTVFVSQDDRALAVSRRVWGSTARLGAIDPDVEPYRTELAQTGITVLNLTKLRSGDSLNHGKFAESPEVVQLIGSRLVEGQPITDSRVGLGERLMQVTAGTAAAVGTAAGLAISAPIAVVDPHTRRNFNDTIEQVGRSVGDAGQATGEAVTAPFEAGAPSGR